MPVPASAVFDRHAAIADATRAAIDTWQQAGAIFNVHDPASRSNSVSVFRFENDKALKVREFCQRNCGVWLGGGLGRFEDETIRIGHMGHVNAHTILGCLGAVDVAFAAMGSNLTHTGVGAALRVLGQETSTAD